MVHVVLEEGFCMSGGAITIAIIYSSLIFCLPVHKGFRFVLIGLCQIRVSEGLGSWMGLIEAAREHDSSHEAVRLRY